MSMFPEDFPGFTAKTLSFLETTARDYRLTRQDSRKLLIIAQDLAAWGQPPVEDLWEAPPPRVKGKNRRQWSLKRLENQWRILKESPRDYSSLLPPQEAPAQEPQIFQELPPENSSTLLGTCPVSSKMTRCCQLLTLDVVINCGFDCSYCTIQSFYKNNTIRFHRDLGEKLKRLDLDPRKIYHIGTGQSSDSLLWGNRQGLLDHLLAFAAAHPNIILELKTKSRNVGPLVEREIPPNVLTTWSLNTPAIILHEERGTASLEERLTAAEKIAARGRLVGFHFHPMIPYKGWEEEYGRVIHQLLERFTPEQVACVSFGTLTFIKPVIKAIRQRGLRTKILQMPLEETAGKFSYPRAVKASLFRTAYEEFSPWHEEVFFYLCMEEATLWKPVFQKEYKSNEDFEKAMKAGYLKKIRLLRP